MKTVKRKNKDSLINALNEAQKLVFAPLAFPAIVSMLDLGIIEFLDKQDASEDEIISYLRLDEYTVRTLLEIGILNNIVSKNNTKYTLTKTGQMFLYNEMTKTNLNYVKDVCYLAASELTNSFKEKKPKGLHKFVGNYQTIYPVLTKLPEKMQKSWYEFDHFYSDNCFEEVFSIITKKYTSIFDIGGNTGNFETLCLNFDSNFDIMILDLSKNIEKIKNNNNLKNCKFYPINVLDKNPNYPKIKNSAILMSQFLDCFSKKDIKKILMDIKNIIDNNSSVYILEPYTDEQFFEGEKYALSHISLYFTCMANGVSKFYTLKEMGEIILNSGFSIVQKYNNIGSYNYTLLELKKNEMVSG